MPKGELISALEEVSVARVAAAAQSQEVSRLELELEAAREQMSTAIAEAAALRRASVNQVAAATAADAAAEARLRLAMDHRQEEMQMLMDRLKHADKEHEKLLTVITVSVKMVSIFECKIFRLTCTALYCLSAMFICFWRSYFFYGSSAYESGSMLR